MPQSVGPIPQGTPITIDGKPISVFFRLRWEEVRAMAQRAGTVAGPPDTAFLSKNAALPLTRLYTTTAAGMYRVTYYARKTVADGVSSSFTFSWNWTEDGVPLSEAGKVVTTDTTGAMASETQTFWADANTDLSCSMAYVSNTPGTMTYSLWVCVESLA